MPNRDALADIQVFCRVAELGGFARAAEALLLTSSAVTKAVQRLETRLGTSLLIRTTRRVTLTEEGAVLFQHCRAALQSIEEATLAVGGTRGRAVGRLRVALPTTYGQKRIFPRLPGFQAQHPGLELELHVTNRVIDLVEEGFDLVVQLGQPPVSSLIQKVLEHASIGVFAAPSYLAERPALRHPRDLAAHVAIGFVLNGAVQPLDFTFVEDGRTQLVRPPPGPVVVHDPMGMVALGIAGGGLFQTGHYVVAEELAQGRLVEVLVAHGGATRPVVATYPPNRRLSAKVRAFLDYFG
jgi:DNA-binding transcriptional LysR family regulator